MKPLRIKLGTASRLGTWYWKGDEGSAAVGNGGSAEAPALRTVSSLGVMGLVNNHDFPILAGEGGAAAVTWTGPAKEHVPVADVYAAGEVQLPPLFLPLFQTHQVIGAADWVSATEGLFYEGSFF